jgi:hypothetical protein
MFRLKAAYGERTMKKLMVSAVVVAGLLSFGIGQAQTVGQDMKDAGHHTAHASKTVGHKTVHGTKAAHKTADVSKEGYHKTTHGTKKVIHKIDGKPSTE